jgi:hypothetical protein
MECNFLANNRVTESAGGKGIMKQYKNRIQRTQARTGSKKLRVKQGNVETSISL